MNLQNWRDAAWYTAKLPENLLTPALAIYPEAVRQNVRATLKLVETASRWRPHLKTVKAEFAMRIMVEEGVTQCKCATLLEVETAIAAGFRDLVIAMSLVGPAVQRTLTLAKANPGVKLAALVESSEHLAPWNDSGFALFIDVNPGMDRTGIGQERVEEIVALAKAIEGAGCAFAGLHYYDGHITDENMDERCSRAHAGYRKLMDAVGALQAAGLPIDEVITAGTNTFPCSLSFEPFRSGAFHHTVSAGTIVYSDLSSLRHLPESYGYRPAAVVLARVLSRPAAGLMTLDAGHKAVSVDSGVPSGLILELQDATPLKPSEEHLPVDVSKVDAVPVGTLLHLVPRHVCTTVNNFNHCIVVEGGRVTGVEAVTARGRHAPLELATV